MKHNFNISTGDLARYFLAEGARLAGFGTGKPGAPELMVAEEGALAPLFEAPESTEKPGGLRDLYGLFRESLESRSPASAIEDAVGLLEEFLEGEGVSRARAARLRPVIMKAFREYLDLIIDRPPAGPPKAARDLEEFGVVTSDPRVLDVFSLAARVASTPATVLIAGETGTGKELLARYIHALSERAREPLVEVNCAAIPQTLIESELFGHEKGAFTGATSRRKGRFLAANRGTLLMDEVAELDPAAQVKLLRVLQEGTFTPVGSDREIKCDVRIIALSSRDLYKMTREGGFRPELYYRLKVVRLYLPPLRERGDDVMLLTEHFLKKYSLEYQRDVSGFSGEAAKALGEYTWPGNVRELENVVRGAVALAEGPTISLAGLPPEVAGREVEASRAGETLRSIRTSFVEGERLTKKLLKVSDSLLADVLDATRGKWFSRREFRRGLKDAGISVSDRTAGTYLKLLETSGLIEWNREHTVRAKYRLKV